MKQVNKIRKLHFACGMFLFTLATFAVAGTVTYPDSSGVLDLVDADFWDTDGRVGTSVYQESAVQKTDFSSYELFAAVSDTIDFRSNPQSGLIIIFK